MYVIEFIRSNEDGTTIVGFAETLMSASKIVESFAIDYIQRNSGLERSSSAFMEPSMGGDWLEKINDMRINIYNAEVIVYPAGWLTQKTTVKNKTHVGTVQIVYFDVQNLHKDSIEPFAPKETTSRVVYPKPVIKNQAPYMGELFNTIRRRNKNSD